jgi:hypothetical protein
MENSPFRANTVERTEQLHRQTLKLKTPQQAPRTKRFDAGALALLCPYHPYLLRFASSLAQIRMSLTT